MASYTFHGGIHPYDGKELSKDLPIKDFLPKKDAVYPLSQHIGAPAVPCVKKGDIVKVGTKIADAGGFVSAPVYSAVSGTVKSIEKRRVVAGNPADCIVIENDGQFEEIEWPEVKPFEELSKEEIIALVKDAGIVGMGGAGFPTAVKLSPKEPDNIDYVIVNCAECEPYLTSDYRKMLEEREKLIGGLKVSLSLFDHARGILAVEDNKPDCIKKLRELIRDESKITVTPLKTKYPQGSERQLSYASTGRAVNYQKLPADAGCIVNNVDTVIAIYNAVIEGRPLLYRIVTVTGDCIKEPCNYRVPIGSSYSELLEEAGGFTKTPEKVISGGPMMGIALFDLDVPVTKSSSALLCLSKDEVAESESSACINCGRCAEVCPGRVIPRDLARFAENMQEKAFVAHHGLECCECGCCSFICPAKRQLTQQIKSMRKIALANQKKAK